MTIRDQLLKKQLTQPSPTGDSFTDGHATARPYKRWMPGIRTVLRLRYLALKKAVLKAVSYTHLTLPTICSV